MTEVEFGPGSATENTPYDDTGVVLRVEDAVATVTLVRPDRLNAQTPQMWRALRTIGSSLPGTVRVVLVQAAGRAFSAGLDRSVFAPPAPDSDSAGRGSAREASASSDSAKKTSASGDSAQKTSASGESLSDLAAMSPAAAGEIIAGYQAAFGWLARPDIISVAAVQGHAVGAGFQLALACDLRVVAEDATFTMAEAALGLIPDLGGTRRLIELVGYSRALDLCVTARPVPAAQAMALGLVSRLVPVADLNAAALGVVAEVLARPRDAVIEAKALLLRAAASSQADQETAEREAQHRLLRALAGHQP